MLDFADEDSVVQTRFATTALALLRATNFGARLLLEGMSPFLDEASRRGAAAYADAFMRSPSPQQAARLERLLAALKR